MDFILKMMTEKHEIEPYDDDEVRRTNDDDYNID